MIYACKTFSIYDISSSLDVFAMLGVILCWCLSYLHDDQSSLSMSIHERCDTRNFCASDHMVKTLALLPPFLHAASNQNLHGDWKSREQHGYVLRTCMSKRSPGTRLLHTEGLVLRLE